MAKIDTLVQDIRDAKSTAEIATVLFNYRGKTSHASVVVAQEARVWDEPLLLSSLLSGVGSYVLLANPHLPEWAQQRVAMWEVNRLFAEAARAPLDMARVSIRKIVAAGKMPMDGAPMQEVVRVVMAPEKKKLKSFPQRCATALAILLEHPECNSEMIDRVADRVRDVVNVETLLPILSHKYCRPEKKLEVLRGIDLTSARLQDVQLLLDVREARLDPVVRERLKSCKPYGMRTGHEILYRLIADDMEDVRSIFQMLPQTQQQWALVNFRDNLAKRLMREDIVPFLSSPDQKVRLAAISISGKVMPESGRSAPRSPSLSQGRSR